MNQLNEAVKAVKNSGVIVYPTESVYGLGCNPFDEEAVRKLLNIKKRSVDKGLILIASHVRQILPLIKPVEANDLARALKTWPGHHTWIFPKSALVPKWISGRYESIAVRVSNQAFVVELCQNLNLPLVSTSANISTQEQLLNIHDAKNIFGDEIDCYVDLPTGNEPNPSTIHNAHSNTIIR